MMALRQKLLWPVSDVARGALATATDFASGLRRASFREALVHDAELLARAAPTLLPWLVRASVDQTHETLMKVVQEHARRQPFSLALEMDDERWTYRELDEATSRVAHALLRVGVQPGDTVVLLGGNSPFYVAAILGATRAGAVAALVNSHLEGAPLAHAIKASKAKVVLVSQPLASRVSAAQHGVEHVLDYGEGGAFDGLMASAPQTPFEPVPCATSADFVYIFTSGTTGLPKPSRVSHGRTMLAGAAFAEAMWGFETGDKLYCVLPLYHSSGLLLGVGAALIAGVPIALRASFSARAFWTDVHCYQATATLYIGEICRHLLNTEPSPLERGHRLRVAVGNGMRADVWEPFQRRFGIAQIREFYAATEAPGIILNTSGRVGSIGRLPARHLLPMRLVRYDVDTDSHLRDERGQCIECGPGETGELLVRISDAPLSPVFEFKGYTDTKATARKVLTDVFHPGDRFYRSGDLMRVDEDGYFYFVDRIGDTFRWKGENVSTLEVAEALSKTDGIKELAVVGVQVPGMEGQAGLCAVVADGAFNTEAFWRAAQGLPSYAQPRFVRVVSALDVTSTHKIQKSSLKAQGVDPSQVEGPVYIRQEAGYEPLTPALWTKVLDGTLRL